MISIVVPCYNEEKNISALVERFDKIKKQLDFGGFELVLVDNGSRDKTSEAIDLQRRTHSYIKKVSVEVNQGYGYGIICGLQACSGEWLGWIHADLQLPPEAFVKMVEKIKALPNNGETYFFKGRRKNRPISDTLFTMGMGCFESIYLGEKLWDINAQPTMIHRSFFEKLENLPWDFSLDLYVYYMARKQRCEVIRIPVMQHPRMEGKSSWNNGMNARVKLIKRTLIFSRELKKKIEV